MSNEKRKKSSSPTIQFTHDTVPNVLDWIHLSGYGCDHEQYHRLKSSGWTNDCWTFFELPKESGIN